MKPRIKSSVLVSGLWLLGQAAHAVVLPAAHAWSNVSAEVGVQGLAIQLIDLDANDGITPQIMFADNAMNMVVYGPTSGYDQSVLHPANDALPIPSADMALVHPNGSSVASLSPSVLYAGTGYSEVLMTQNAIAEPYGNYWYPNTGFGEPNNWRSNAGARLYDNAQRLVGTYDGQGVLFFTGDDYRLSSSPSAPGFTVTPNTAVVFSGTLFSRARIDFSQLATYDPQNTQAIVQTKGSIALYNATPIDEKTSWTSFQEVQAAFENQWVSVDSDVRRFNYEPSLSMENRVGPETMLIEREENKSFEFTFTNTTVLPKGGFLSVYLQSESVVGGLLPVPEPSVYALMTLGLLGVAGAVRSRQAAATSHSG